MGSSNNATIYEYITRILDKIWNFSLTRKVFIFILIILFFIANVFLYFLPIPILVLFYVIFLRGIKWDEESISIVFNIWYFIFFWITIFCLYNMFEEEITNIMQNILMFLYKAMVAIISIGINILIIYVVYKNWKEILWWIIKYTSILFSVIRLTIKTMFTISFKNLAIIIIITIPVYIWFVAYDISHMANYDFVSRSYFLNRIIWLYSIIIYILTMLFTYRTKYFSKLFLIG